MGPLADGKSATVSPIPNQWVALTAEIDGERGGGEESGTQPPTCIGNPCSLPTIPSLTLPPLTLPSPMAAQPKKKCKKGKKLKHGKCVKKHKRRKKTRR